MDNEKIAVIEAIVREGYPADGMMEEIKKGGMSMIEIRPHIKKKSKNKENSLNIFRKDQRNLKY